MENSENTENRSSINTAIHVVLQYTDSVPGSRPILPRLYVPRCSEWKSISRLYFLFAKPTSFVIYRIIDSFYILNTWNSEVSRKTRHPYLTIIAIRANRHYRIFESWGNTFSLSAMQNICLSIYISRYCSFSQRILRISGRILGRIVSTKGRTRSGYTSSTSIYLSICSKNTIDSNLKFEITLLKQE